MRCVSVISIAYSQVVEIFSLEKNGIEGSLVSYESSFLVEQHIQNPKKSTLGNLFYLRLKFPCVFN